MRQVFCAIALLSIAAAVGAHAAHVEDIADLSGTVAFFSMAAAVVWRR